MSGEGKRGWWIAATAVVALVLSVVTGAWLLLVRPHRARYAAQRASFAAAASDFHAQRWERPVLRGEPVDGNAWPAQMDAMRGPLSSLDGELLVDASDRLRAHEPPGEAAVALADRHREALRVYRQSAQRAWSWGDFPVEDGLSATVPEYVPHLHAAKLLAVQASQAAPDECVSIANDVLRLGQDRAAGRSLVALMIHHATATQAFFVLPRCLEEADPDTLARAARELEVLARHPAPSGYTIEAEVLGAGGMFEALLAPLDGWPTNGAELEAWVDASTTLEAWELLMADAADHRAIGEDYPGDIARYVARGRALAAHGNPLLSIATPMYDRYLSRDASTRALIRMLWAMARLRRGEPLAILEDDEALRDPLTGDPLVSEAIEGGVELRHAGLDGTYTGDPEGDDLTLRVRLPAAEPPPPPE